MSYGTKFSDNILDDPKYLYVGNNSKLILLDWFMFPSLWHYQLCVISGGVLSHHISFDVNTLIKMHRKFIYLFLATYYALLVLMVCF